MLLFLSKLMKNKTNVLLIFKNVLSPVKQRAIAGTTWLQLRTDEIQIHRFINNKDTPRLNKNYHFVLLLQILFNLKKDIRCSYWKNID
jgi:hypothetical protein